MKHWLAGLALLTISITTACGAPAVHNATACSQARAHLVPLKDRFGNDAAGVYLTHADSARPFMTVQRQLADDAKKSGGTVRSHITAVSDTLSRVTAAVNRHDDQALEAEAHEALKAVRDLNSACI
jgi:hypothetical protein